MEIIIIAVLLVVLLALSAALVSLPFLALEITWHDIADWLEKRKAKKGGGDDA